MMTNDQKFDAKLHAALAQCALLTAEVGEFSGVLIRLRGQYTRAPLENDAKKIILHGILEEVNSRYESLSEFLTWLEDCVEGLWQFVEDDFPKDGDES